MKVQILLQILLRMVCLVGVVLLGWIIYTGYAIYQYGNKDEVQTADAIVVLGAGASDGEPSPVFRARLDHGIWLYDNGYGKKLILTGGKGAGAREAAAEIARRYVVGKDVLPQDIFIETKSQSTEENIANVKLLARRAGLNRLIMVSDPLHMKRVMLITREQHLQAFASPAPTTRYRSWKSKLKFLAREIYFYSRYLWQRWNIRFRYYGNKIRT